MPLLPGRPSPTGEQLKPAKVDPPRVAISWSHAVVLAVWSWAVWSCAEHWRGNPNYSYGWAVPLLAFGFAMRRYFRIDPSDLSAPAPPRLRSVWVLSVVGLLTAILIFALEYAREQVWHPEVVLWVICLLAVGSTLAIFQIRAGSALVRAELFPVMFFLTAVPWPPRFEQPIVSSLMRWVAQATTELLHWFGVEA